MKLMTRYSIIVSLFLFSSSVFAHAEHSILTFENGLLHPLTDVVHWLILLAVGLIVYMDI